MAWKTNMINRFLLSCSVLLAVTTIAHMRHLESQFQPETYMTLTKDRLNKAIIGRGIKEDHLPVIECLDERNPFKLNCTVHIRTGESCKIYFGNKRTIGASTQGIHQLADKKVLILWRKQDMSDDKQHLSINNTILVLDMNTCVITNAFDNPEENMDINYKINVLTYETGFDVILNKVITSYDINGYQIDEPKPFMIDGYVWSIHQGSRLSRYGNFFVFGFNKDSLPNASLRLANHKGEEIELLMRKIMYNEYVEYLSNDDQPLFTYCETVPKDFKVMTNRTTIECHQFDEFGDLTYKDLWDIDGAYYLFDGRNLKLGGVLIFLVEYKDSDILHVFRKQTDDKTAHAIYKLDTDMVYYHPISKKITPRVIDFNEDNGTFAVAYGTPADQPGRSIIIQKYKLPDILP